MSASVLNGTADRDLIDRRCPQTGSYRNIDKEGHSTRLRDVLLRLMGRDRRKKLNGKQERKGE